MDNIKLISGSSHTKLSKTISEYLNIPLCDCILEKFSNTEIRVEIKDNIRNKDIFIIQTGGFNEINTVNDNLIETLIIIDACKRSMSKSITLIMPNYPYARQDKKNESRAPISAKLVANLLEKSGIDRMVVMDLHAQQIQGFFDIPVDNIYSINLVVNYLEKHIFSNLSLTQRKDKFIVISPDSGGIRRALKFSKSMKLPSLFMYKQRNYEISNTIDKIMLVGDKKIINGKIALIIDDICDTCSTLIKSCDILKDNGIKEVYCIITHGILSGPALDRINNCKIITKMIVSDTLPQEKNCKKCPKLEYYSIGKLMGSVIKRITIGDSISELF